MLFSKLFGKLVNVRRYISVSNGIFINLLSVVN